MKARLYRGPHDGRVLEVPDHQRSIKLKRMAKTGFFEAFAKDFQTLQTHDDEYVQKFREFTTADGRRYLAPCMHPDGTMFFEWTKKRGTRIER